jgi:hypothetical protein
MEKEKIEAAFDNFLNPEESKKEDKAVNVKTKKINKKSDEIIEHVEKKLVVEDGRELLL